MNREPLEIEVKFHINAIAEIRDKIVNLGALSQGRCFETNIRFEDEHHRLIRRRALLRLRKDRKTTLTFKSEVPDDGHQFKICNELEVEVNDFDTMHQILESIGFHGEQVYEKWRETFILDDATLCIDTLPIGSFLEIEGTGAAIKPIAKNLGLRWEDRILINYLALFEIIKQGAKLTFKDMTFDNFKNTDIDIDNYLRDRGVSLSNNRNC
jgi:adenylate cyclase class 2